DLGHSFEKLAFVVRGWLFSYDPFWRPAQMKALLHSVPIGNLVVFDLFAEVKPLWITSEQFYGVPYIWCMLHNIDGNIEMYGILDAIAAGPVEAHTSENSTMAILQLLLYVSSLNFLFHCPKVGVGMSMEGIEQNPVVYDLMSEMAFQHKKIDVKVNVVFQLLTQMWIDLYPMRRYGSSDSLILDAWSILYHSVYNCTDGAYNKNRDVIVAFPDAYPFSISLEDISFNGKHQILTEQVLRICHVKELTDSYDKPHLWYLTFDVIHSLGLLIAGGNEVAESNTYRYDLVDVTRQALAKYANEVFLKVRDWRAQSNLHKRKSRKNREQILEWTLTRDYYAPRAAIYFKDLLKSLENGVGFQLKDWRREWIKLTNDWQNNINSYPVKSTGGALSTSRWLYEKYMRNPDILDH
ncbi:hypothetical protein IFM89_000791, partial [Coptis chinensis]